jgi:ATP-dependent 26S proteasome regulatory subunit
MSSETRTPILSLSRWTALLPVTGIRILPREVDPLVYNMTMEDPNGASFAGIGGQFRVHERKLDDLQEGDIENGRRQSDVCTMRAELGGILPREVDPLVYNMTMEDPNGASFAGIGGLSDQIRELREVRHPAPRASCKHPVQEDTLWRLDADARKQFRVHERKLDDLQEGDIEKERVSQGSAD